MIYHSDNACQSVNVSATVAVMLGQTLCVPQIIVTCLEMLDRHVPSSVKVAPTKHLLRPSIYSSCQHLYHSDYCSYQQYCLLLL